MARGSLLLLFLFAFTGCILPSSLAVIFNVYDNTTLLNCASSSTAGDLCLIQANTIINLTTTLTLGGPVVIQGSGNSIIDLMGVTSLAGTLNHPVTLQDLEVRNGKTAPGVGLGALWGVNGAFSNLTNVYLRNMAGGWTGGVIYGQNSGGYFRNVTFDTCSTYYSGGSAMFVQDLTWHFEDVTFVNMQTSNAILYFNTWSGNNTAEWAGNIRFVNNSVSSYLLEFATTGGTGYNFYMTSDPKNPAKWYFENNVGTPFVLMTNKAQNQFYFEAQSVLVDKTTSCMSLISSYGSVPTGYLLTIFNFTGDVSLNHMNFMSATTPFKVYVGGALNVSNTLCSSLLPITLYDGAKTNIVANSVSFTNVNGGFGVLYNGSLAISIAQSLLVDTFYLYPALYVDSTSALYYPTLSLTAGDITIRGGATAALVSCGSNLINITTQGDLSLSGNIASYASSLTICGGSAKLTSGAGVYARSSNVYLTTGGKTTFASNSGTDNGGAIMLATSTLLLQSNLDISFSDNSATNGGAIWADTSALTISTAGTLDWSSNSASTNGGALFINATGTQIVSGLGMSFTSNTAAFGGAIQINASTLALTASQFSFSSNTGSAIALTTGSDLQLQSGLGISFDNNTGANGGALNVFASSLELNASQVTFTNNSAPNGGAIWATSATLNLSTGGQIILENNAASGYGGGLCLASPTAVLLQAPLGISFVNNSAAYGGAAALPSSYLSLVSSASFNGNSAGFSGCNLYFNDLVCPSTTSIPASFGINYSLRPDYVLNSTCPLQDQSCVFPDQLLCPPPIPTPYALCRDNQWFIPTQDLTGGGTTSQPIIISVPTVIVGNSGDTFVLPQVNVTFSVNNTIFDIPLLSSNSCISVSNIVMNQTAEDLQLIEQSSRTLQLIKSNCNSTTDTTLTLIGAQPTQDCKKERTTVNNYRGDMAATFSVDQFQCSVWWIILASVLGGVVLIVGAIVAIFVACGRVRKTVNPYHHS